eukprot:9966534-Lingulodinium_polyedra.AAC.1
MQRNTRVCSGQRLATRAYGCARSYAMGCDAMRCDAIRCNEMRRGVMRCDATRYDATRRGVM